MKYQEESLTRFFIAASFCRLLLNTARRFVYPFAPALSRGLGLPITDITSLIAINQASAFLGIFFGPLSDRFGYRFMMLSGMGMLSAGMLLAGFLPFYVFIGFGLLLSGLGKSIFDPAIQAFVGQHVPFHRRGAVMGLMEVCWAGSTLIGIPLIGILIEKAGWRAPFFALGVLGLSGMVLIYKIMLPARPHSDIDKTPGINKTTGNRKRQWSAMIRNPAAWSALGFAFFISAANDNLFVIYGVWLDRSFELSLAGIGLGTMVIGISELTGEFMTAGLSDRMGLKQAVLGGLVLSTAGYGLLPFLNSSLPPALVGLAIIFMTYEFTIVTFLSICTEILPEARATMMAAFYAAAGLGRVAGDLSGGLLWVSGGLHAVCTASALINAAAIFFILFGLKKFH